MRQVCTGDIFIFTGVESCKYVECQLTGMLQVCYNMQVCGQVYKGSWSVFTGVGGL